MWRNTVLDLRGVCGGCFGQNISHEPHDSASVGRAERAAPEVEVIRNRLMHSSSVIYDHRHQFIFVPAAQSHAKCAKQRPATAAPAADAPQSQQLFLQMILLLLFSLIQERTSLNQRRWTGHTQTGRGRSPLCITGLTEEQSQPGRLSLVVWGWSRTKKIKARGGTN